MPVHIKDRHGKIARNLRREDFHLFEDGVEQEIVLFDPPKSDGSGPGDVRAESQKPLTVALLLDVSDSTERKLKEIQDVAIVFVNQLRPGDRVLVMAFDKNVRVLTEATDKRNHLREAISQTRTGRGTSLYDAVDSVITWLNRISGRKAIVLLTDGVDTASLKGTYDGTVRAADQLDAAIYPIQFNTYADFADNPTRQTDAFGSGGTAHMTKTGELASDAYKRATIYLRLLAEKTGGNFEYTDSLKNLSRSFGRIASTLEEQYTLGYYPKDQTPDRRTRILKIKVALPAAKIHARPSYVLKPRNH